VLLRFGVCSPEKTEIRKARCVNPNTGYQLVYRNLQHVSQ
jgi:hypothetical protein